VISGVAGLNNETFSNGVTVPDSFTGTCTTCHDTPNVGNHSVKAPLNIGLTDASPRTPDMPLYTLRNIATGETVQTTDPGRAMTTGKWADIGKFKGPVLRALAAQAPYFHNGSAATLEESPEKILRKISRRAQRARRFLSFNIRPGLGNCLNPL
jgi:cytochrome c peroxidase